MRLEAESISFRYPCGRALFEDYSCAMETGETVGVRAPSGFGKTTLCKLLAGYIQPAGGRVLLDGKPLSLYRGYSPVQLIWQHPELVLNPRLKLKHALLEVGGVEPRIVQGLGIEPAWLERYPAELSGGELQRFCIARALRPESRFLLADEISTMLDLVTQAQIWQFLREETAQRGLGLLVVSHSDGLLEQLCARYLELPETI